MLRRRRPKESNNEIDSLRAQVEELSAALEVTESILSSMTEAVVLIESDGSVGYANRAGDELLRTDPSVASTFAKQNSAEFTVHHPKLRTYRSTVVDTERQRKVAVIQDVTEAKRLEVMRRDLVGDVSHELKTPVAGILAAAETLQLSVSEDPESSHRFVASLLREAQRLSRLVEDLLDLARVEQHHPAGESVHLAPLIKREVGNILAMAKAKGLTVKMDLDEELLVVGHGEDLALAVRNLLMNAVRYTDQGGTNVRLSREGQDGRLDVADTGLGIPNKDLPRIFERFYRVDKARSRETGGTGLGLSIVKHVVERHGGRVFADSSLGEGSRFTIILPLAKASSS